MIDLSPAHFAIVERILAEHVPDCEVRAFGSRATWNAKDYSDLDLAIIGDEPLPRRTVARLKEAFEESRLPMRVDVVDWHAIGDGFRQAIESDCVVVQEPASRVDWRGVRLGDYAEVTKGVSYKGAHLNQPGPLLLGLGEFSPGGGAKLDKVRTYGGDYRERHVVRSGDLLVALTDLTQSGAVLGSPMIVPAGTGEFCLYTHHVGRVALHDPESMDASFLRYVLQDFAFSAFVSGRATGTTVRAVHPREVAQFQFPLPPLEEQRAIAHVLGALDDKIELNRRMSETLEEMARALFRSWFVDFDPVRAKSEGLPSGLPPDLDALFPASFEASALGEIPAGWAVKALGDVIDVNPRRQIRRGDVATHVEMAALPTSGPHVAAWTQRAFTSGSRFTRGDTLLARITPSLENGKTAFVDFLDDGETGWGSTEFIVLRPKPPWPPEIGYVMAREPDFREHAIVNMTGTSGRQRVPAEAVATYALAEPPGGAVEGYGGLVRPFFERATSLRDESRSLAEQRDALLPKLVSGELRVALGALIAS